MNVILFMLIFITFSLFILFIGFLYIIKSGLVIEIQRRFYEKINWRIEPISMPKELRNTQLMGWLLIIVWLATFIYSVANNLANLYLPL